MTTTPGRPKGAMTKTARGSVWFVGAYAVLALLNGWLYVVDDRPQRLRLVGTLIWIVLTVVY